MSTQKLNQTQIDGQVYAYGTIAGTATAGVKGLSQIASSGITYNGSNSYAVVTKGIYYIHAQQLQETGGTPTYFRIDVNGTTKRYGYMTAGKMGDIGVSEMCELNVADTITIYQQNAITTAWGGEHSGYSIHLIKRT